MSGDARDDIPDGTEQISARWLTEMMQERAPGIRASEAEIVDAHSGTTGRVHLRVRWSDGGLPPEVFCKLPPTDPMQRAIAVETGMGAREARFYRHLARDVPVRVPRPYASRWTDDRRAYVMLIEDLAAAGCRFPGFVGGADRDVVRGVMEGLAKLHAAFWRSPRFDGDLAWIEPPMHSDMGPDLVAAGVESFGADQPEAFHAMARVYVENGAAVARRLALGPATLLHGDPHLGNLFLDGDEVGFLDWACVCRGPGLRDVAYFLGSSVETELRRAEERAFLAHYLDVLGRAGAPAPDLDDAWREYRVLVASAWIAAAATYAVGDRMQSAEVGRRGVERANAAVADLGTADLLGEEIGRAI